jgi:hypothetical protein
MLSKMPARNHLRMAANLPIKMTALMPMRKLSKVLQNGCQHAHKSYRKNVWKSLYRNNNYLL